MSIKDDITKQKQSLARAENALAIEKIKKRKQETRRKIELGGLVIKAGMDQYDKATVLGALIYIKKQMNDDENFEQFIKYMGENKFMDCQ